MYSKKEGKLELEVIRSKTKKEIKSLVITVLLTNNFQTNFLD